MIDNNERETGQEFVTEIEVSPEKQLLLDAALRLLNKARVLAHESDVDLDFADALRTTADELEKGYSTVKFRYTGIPFDTEPGRVRK